MFQPSQRSTGETGAYSNDEAPIGRNLANGGRSGGPLAGLLALDIACATGQVG